MSTHDARLDGMPLPDKGILETLIEEKLTSVEELATLSRRSESTVRRWVRRESWPDVIDFHLIMTGLHSDEARRRVVARMFAELPVAIAWRDAPAPSTAHADVSERAANVIYEMARLLQHARHLERGEESPGKLDQDSIEAISTRAIDELIALREVVQRQTARRRAARPATPS
ncbi:MAG: hypothetical protein AAFY08_03085 [Planctomycetota bacterium]